MKTDEPNPRDTFRFANDNVIAAFRSIVRSEAFTRKVAAEVAAFHATVQSSDLMRQAAAQVAAFQQANQRMLREAASGVAAFQQANQRMLREAASEVAAFQQANQKMIREAASSVLRVQRELLSETGIQRLVEAWDRRQREAADILLRKGWWLSPDFPLPLLNRVISMKRNGRGRQINRVLCDYYTGRRLSSLVKKWLDEPLFKARQRPLKEALRAHKEGQWLSSIPILLAQEEGILRDYAEQLKMPRRQSVKKIAKMVKAKSADAGLVSDTWLVQLSEIFSGGFDKTEPKVPGLRRNAILHGLEIHYGTELRSLQLFMQLDTIHWLIVERSKKSKAKGKKTRKRKGRGGK